MLAGLLLMPLIVATAVPTGTALANTCGGVETSIITCEGSRESDDVADSGLWHLLIMVVNIMTVGVGVLALAGLVYGAVLYTSSGGNPEQVKKARVVFTNVVIGVISFGLMFTLLNFLVPGGVFN